MGFATLESFRREVDSERIAAIARERAPDGAGRVGNDREPAERGPDDVLLADRPGREERGHGSAGHPPDDVLLTARSGRVRLDPDRAAGVARRARLARERTAGADPASARRTEARQRTDSVPRHGIAPPAESIPLQRAARRAKRARQGWVVALTTVIVVIALAACGTASWFLLRDNAGNTTAPEQAHTADPSTGSTKAEPDKLASRDTDRRPLSSKELFGDTELAAGNGSYRVLKTEALADCATAATDTMGPHLKRGDCTQVVRATVADAAGEHAATVGVVNLADAEAATRLRKNIEDGSGGAFNALRAQGVSSELGRAPTVLGFNTFGHYLLYAVIGRSDGESPSRDDAEVSAIVADLVDAYLVERLEPRRE